MPIKVTSSSLAERTHLPEICPFAFSMGEKKVIKTVILGNTLLFSTHINNVSCSAFYCTISTLHSFLPQCNMQVLALTLVTTCLDYCHSCWPPQQTFNQLEMAQNSVARIIISARSIDHITPLLIRLHLICSVFCFTAYNTSICSLLSRAPTPPLYLSDLLHP